jgi:hypothetical protein
MLDIIKDVVVMVTGTNIKPFDNNHKECEATWIPRLREIGFRVIVAVGNPEIDARGKKTLDDFTNYFEFIDEDTIKFNTFDKKPGLFDKSINLPAKWVLEETNYKYYFRIDSDSFVAPFRFYYMLKDNFRDFPDLDYLGCCHPWLGWNPHNVHRQLICREGHFAAGCGYMVSRRAMKIALDKMKIVQPNEFEADDWVLGRAMWESGIPLLHDSRIFFQSKHKEVIQDTMNIGNPDIGDMKSHLAIQHYMNGHMENAKIRLKW